jgi:hypothetical protein
MTISIPLTPPLMDEEHQGEVPKDKGGPDGEDEFNGDQTDDGEQTEDMAEVEA